MTSRVYSNRTISKLKNLLKRRNKRIVFTNGCFDILHAGHVDYLSRARALGDVLVVGLNSDTSVRKIKGRGRPINHERDRARVLQGLSSVDFIVIFSEETPEKLIRALQPNILVKGADWKRERIAGSADVLRAGGTVRRVRLLRGRSTSRTIKRMRRGS